jgi:glycosyltransferase involved in cell wall biosynthesis
LVDIVVVRTANSIIYDPRVRKIIGSLRKKYSISALGWNRELVSQDKINNYFAKVELFNLRTSFWKPSLARILIRLLIFFPPFWIWALAKLIVNRPKIVHACDLDSVLPCYIYKTIFKKKLVFEVFDRYAMTFIPSKFKGLYRLVNSIEESFSEHSDLLIIANGQITLDTFRKKPKHCTILLNCPEDQVVDIPLERSPNEIFTILFTGHIRRHRGLETLAVAIGDLRNVELIITGRTEDKALLTQIQGKSNVKYLGFLEDQEVLTMEISSDVMVALYDPDILGNRIMLPNKLFDAMMCGVPIITNLAHEIINETECGIIVEYDNLEQIKEAIIKLKDNPELRKRLGANGRKAFLEKYNWNVMEQRLYKVYEDLLSNRN